MKIGISASLGGLIVSIAIGGATPSGAAALNITTHHYNNARTGWNEVETVLTPASVRNDKFGLLAAVEMDEQVDAQPLYVANLLVKGQTAKHNVLYVATERNTVYAIDADTGVVLLSRNLGIPVSYATTGYCSSNSGNIGIGSTPAINLAAKTMYVIADTLEKGAPVFRLHALDLTDLTDVKASVVVRPKHKLSNGATYSFNAYVTRQRSALLYANGNVYAAFASYCDFNADQSRGWVLGWDGTTLAPLAASELTDSQKSSTNSYFLSAVWMSGAGIAADARGYLWFVTGNSDPAGDSYSSTANLAESAVRILPDLSKVASYFTPSDRSSLDQEDGDFGSGGIMVLPNQGSTPNLATAAGKDGNLYLMNIASPGGYNPGGPNKVLDTQNIGGCWCAESYFSNSAGNWVVSSGGGTVQTWKVVMTSKPHLDPAHGWSAGFTDLGQDGGVFTAVSSNGTKAGIVWAVARPDGSNNNAIYLDAFNASNGQPLFSQMIAGFWPNTEGNANVVPVVSNGKVYVASYGQVDIFGLNASGSVKSLGTRSIAATPMAAASQLHVLYGTADSFENSSIALRTRTGKTVTVAADDAIKEYRITWGAKKLAVLGTYDSAGVMHAVSIGRAKNDVASWGPDR